MAQKKQLVNIDLENDYKKLVQETFIAQNKLRTDPKSFIPLFQNQLQYFKGKVLHLPNQTPLLTKEGAPAVLEVIEFLKQQKQINPMEFSENLSKACSDHMKDIGEKGMCSHEGSDGSTINQRVEKYGDWMGSLGENISFGQRTGESVVMQLVCDDGVASRGHRENLFEEKFKITGIAAGQHKIFKIGVVLDYCAQYGLKGSTPPPLTKDDLAKEMKLMTLKDQQESKVPEGTVSTQTQTSISVVNGVKTTTITKTYKDKNGKTTVQTNVYTTTN